MTEETSLLPDEDYTTHSTESEVDYTSTDIVGGRSFFITLKFTKYGTRDPIQGASFFLAFMLISLATITYIASLIPGTNVESGFYEWIASPLMLSLGVAIGRNTT